MTTDDDCRGHFGKDNDVGSICYAKTGGPNGRLSDDLLTTFGRLPDDFPTTGGRLSDDFPTTSGRPRGDPPSPRQIPFDGAIKKLDSRLRGNDERKKAEWIVA
jgi:hypothetical protein